MTEKAIQAALETDDLFTRAVEKAFAAYQAMQPKDAHEDAWVEAACRAFLQEIQQPSDEMTLAAWRGWSWGAGGNATPYRAWRSMIDHLLSTSSKG